MKTPTCCVDVGSQLKFESLKSQIENYYQAILVGYNLPPRNIIQKPYTKTQVSMDLEIEDVNYILGKEKSNDLTCILLIR